MMYIFYLQLSDVRVQISLKFGICGDMCGFDGYERCYFILFILFIPVNVGCL